jgi:hypothetical protein
LFAGLKRQMDEGGAMNIRLPLLSLLLATALPVTAQMGAGNQPRDSFSNFDTDRDGVITEEEARQEEILNRFDQMDQDLDGEVTEREFNAMDAPGIATGATGATGAGTDEQEEPDGVAEFRVNP